MMSTEKANFWLKNVHAFAVLTRDSAYLVIRLTVSKWIKSVSVESIG